MDYFDAHDGLTARTKLTVRDMSWRLTVAMLCSSLATIIRLIKRLEICNLLAITSEWIESQQSMLTDPINHNTINSSMAVSTNDHTSKTVFCDSCVG